MEIILLGLGAGVMATLVMILLVEKAPPTIRELVYGHYLLSDILCTAAGMTMLPVVGMVTLFTALAFFLLFTVYLGYCHTVRPYARIQIFPYPQLHRYA